MASDWQGVYQFLNPSNANAFSWVALQVVVLSFNEQKEALLFFQEATSRNKYLAVMFLLNMCKESSIAKICFSTRAFIVAWFDSFSEIIGIKFLRMHDRKSIIYKMRI